MGDLRPAAKMILIDLRISYYMMCFCRVPAAQDQCSSIPVFPALISFSLIPAGRARISQSQWLPAETFCGDITRSLGENRIKYYLFNGDSSSVLIKT